MESQNSSGSAKISTANVIESNGKKSREKFTFKNGDAYEGEYKFDADRFLLLKHGYGMYITDDFNVYEGQWKNDTFDEHDAFHIRYNNGATYIGGVNAEGEMCGSGIYIFPDGNSIEGTWHKNKSGPDINFKEQMGFRWIVHERYADKIIFASGNHFWDEILREEINDSSSRTYSTTEETMINQSI